LRDAPVVIETTSYEEFRDNIHLTQLFDMLDCTVEIVASPIGPVEDIERIVSLIESMINVIDVRITSRVDSEDYVITLTPVVMNAIKRTRK
jgi:hypothetical protein